MSDIYSIAMKISLTGGASEALAVMAANLMKMESYTARIQKGFEGWHKALLGVSAILAGGAIIGGLVKLTAQAEDLTHQLTQIKKLGVSGSDFEAYRAAAFAAHTKVPGTTSVDALKILATTHSMFGVQGSLKILEPLLKFQQVMGNATGDYAGAAEKMKEMIRGGELMGKFVDQVTHKVDTGKLVHFLELGTKVAAATHGMVDAHTWLMLAQQGGPALSNMSDEGLLSMAMVAQAMRGQRAGTALTSLSQQMVGGKMTEFQAKKLQELGLVGDYTKSGHSLIWDKGALNTPFASALQRDPMDAANILLEALHKSGKFSMEEIIPELYQILGRQTTQRLVHELVRNYPQMMDEKGRIKQGLGLNAATNVQNSEDYMQVMQNYHAAQQEMLMHMGLPLMKAAIPVMKAITSFVDKIAEYVKMNPEVVERVAKGLAALAGALMIFGTGVLVSMIGAGGWLAIGFSALAGAIAALPKEQFEAVINGFKTIGGIAWGVIKIGFESLIGFLKVLPGILGDIWNSIKGWFQKTSFEGGGGFGEGGGFQRASLGSALGGPVIGNTASERERLAYIRAGAIARGMDPNVISRLVANEGLHSFVGDRGSSFGDFQLHLGGVAGGGMAVGGLGDQFQRETGLSVRNPANWKAMTDWSLNWMARHKTLSPWHGWKGPPGAGLGGAHPISVSPYHGGSSRGGGDVVLNVDGETLGRVASKHIAMHHMHSRRAPYFDGKGMYAGADIRMAV